MTEELDWGFESSPVAPKDSSQASGFLTAQSPLGLPAAAASSVATCLSPATALSAGAAVATGAVPVSAGLSIVHTPAVSHPEIPLRVQETFRVSDPVQPKGKAAAVITTSQPLQSLSATQDPAPAAVPGIPLSSSPATTPVDRSQEGSSSAPVVAITPAEAANRRDHRLNRNLRAKLLTFWGYVLEPKEAEETWDENNTIAQGWLDDFARKAGPSPSARPSPEALR